MFSIRSYFTERSYTKDLESILAESFRLQKTFSKDTLNRAKFGTPKSTGERRENLLKLLATVGEYSYYIVLFRPRPVQFAAGLRLYDSVIAEIKTGEGKTLIGALVAIVKKLVNNKRTIVLTTSDFLAYEGAERMGPLYQSLGLSCVALISSMTQDDKNSAYSNHVVYMTSQEYAFQFLRDGSVANAKDLALPGNNDNYFFLIDEVDSVLLDQALSPIILSGGSPSRNVMRGPNANTAIVSRKIKKASAIVGGLSKNVDYTMGMGIANSNSIYLTANAINITLPLLIPDGQVNITEWLPYIIPALKAKELYLNRIQYILRDNEVKIIDSSTGRIGSQQRWRDGLHEAVEAKEGLEPKTGELESTTYASVTYPGLVTMFFNDWAAMSGTLLVIQDELRETYAKRTAGVPPNIPSKLTFLPDELFEKRGDKFNAVIDMVKEIYRSRRPLLIVCTTMLDTDILSDLLTLSSIPFQRIDCLTPSAEETAKVQRAGLPGAVTIGTNVLGRGMDTAISEESLKSGGLFVIGMERSISNRVDLQLAGRAGRNGELGSCKFLMSLQDPLFSLNATNSDRKKLKTCIHPAKKTKQLKSIVRSLQSRSEGLNYTTRKQSERLQAPILDRYNVLRSTRRLMLERATPRKELKDLDDRWVKYLEDTEELTKSCRIQAIMEGRDPIPLTLRALTKIDNYY